MRKFLVLFALILVTCCLAAGLSITDIYKSCNPPPIAPCKMNCRYKCPPKNVTTPSEQCTSCPVSCKSDADCQKGPGNEHKVCCERCGNVCLDGRPVME